MNPTEQQYLTERVEKAFQHLGYYNTPNYTRGLATVEALAQLPVAKAEDEKVLLGKAFSNSLASAIAKEELLKYVLSSPFRENLTLGYYQVELAQGKRVPTLPLDGSVKEVDIDQAFEVRNYLIQVSRLSQLYEQDRFQSIFTRHFLETPADADEYMRRPCHVMLQLGQNRKITFDDAVGFELGAFEDIDYLKKKAQRNLQNYMGEGKILNETLFEEVKQKMQSSDGYALLFSDQIIQFLAYQAFTQKEGSLAELRLRQFVARADNIGFIAAFEQGTPYPMLEPREIKTFEDKVSQIQEKSRYDVLQHGFCFETKHLKKVTVTDKDRAKKSATLLDRVRLEASGGTLCYTRTPLDIELFSRKVLNHVNGHDPWTFTFFSQEEFTDRQEWPMIIEELGTKHKPILEALMQEIITQKPQRRETAFKSEGTPARQRFTSDAYPAREIERDGKKYIFEIDRRLESVIGILCDRESRDQTWDDDGAPHSIGRVLADFDAQFISVYKAQGDARDKVGAVWLDGSSRLGGDKLDYYDEIEHEIGLGEELAPLRPALMQYAREFALHCGYKELEFDSNELIVSESKKQGENGGQE